MPRYFFDLPYQADDLGADLADENGARKYALRCLMDLIGDSIANAADERYWRIDVRRDDGAMAFSVLTELLPSRHLSDRQMSEIEAVEARPSTRMRSVK